MSLRSYPRHLERGFGGRLDRRFGNFRRVGDRGAVGGLAGADQPDRRMLGAQGNLRGGDDNRRAAAHRADDFEQMQRLADVARVEHVRDRQRRVIEHGERVAQRVVALVHGDLRHLLGLGPIHGHVPLGDQRVAAVGSDCAVGRLELVHQRDHRRPAFAHLVEIGGQAQHRVAHPGVDRGRRAPDHPGAAGAADIHHIEHPRAQVEQLPDCRGIDHPRVGGRHPDQQPVDVLLFQTGVGNRLGRHRRHQIQRGRIARIAHRPEFADSDCRSLALKTHDFALLLQAAEKRISAACSLTLISPGGREVKEGRHLLHRVRNAVRR